MVCNPGRMLECWGLGEVKGHTPDHVSMKSFPYAAEKVRSFISLISAPAAKAFSEPVRTMAEMFGFDWKERRAEFSSRMSGVERALRALGRLSWTETLD